MNLESEIDHLLRNFNTNEHIVVIDDLGEELGSTHTNLNDGYLLVAFLLHLG